MINLDQSTEFGARVARRLGSDEVIWLSTVRADGTPEPTPVWFYWDGQTFLIYSQPNTPKLRHIQANPHVALNLNSSAQGGDVVIFTGEARIARNEPPASAVPQYLAKYRDPIARIGMTPDSFAQGYSVPIRVEPMKVRGH